MSIVKRTTTCLAVMVAAIATTTAVTATPSFAAYPITAESTSWAGYAYFNGDGQVMAIHDSHKDGYGVGVIYYRYDLAHTGPYYAWNQEGNGTTTYLYLNMPSGAGIKFYACPEQGGIILDHECGQGAFASVPI